MNATNIATDLAAAKAVDVAVGAAADKIDDVLEDVVDAASGRRLKSLVLIVLAVAIGAGIYKWWQSRDEVQAFEGPTPAGRTEELNDRLSA